MAHYFPASDPAIERHFAMLDAGSDAKYQEDSSEERDGVRSMHCYRLGDTRHVQIRIVDRASASMHDGVRPQTNSSSHRSPFGRSYGAPRSSASSDTSSSGANSIREFARSGSADAAKTPTRTERTSVPPHGAPASSRSSSSSSGSSNDGEFRLHGCSISFAPVQPSSFTTSRDRLRSGSALPASGLKSASRLESPTGPFMQVAGRSLSSESGDSSHYGTDYLEMIASPTTSTASENSIKGSSPKARISAVKVVSGADPAALELYFKRKAQERSSRAAARPTHLMAAAAGEPAPS